MTDAMPNSSTLPSTLHIGARHRCAFSAAPTTGRGRRLFCAVVGITLLVALAAGCGSDGQGGLKGASPGPDATVGGEIDQIELFYDDLVVAADGSVTGPDGAELATVFRIDTEISVIIELGDVLTEPGEYTVRHAVDTAAGDRVEDSFSFTFDATAPPPRLVFPPESSGTPWLLWAIALVGVAVIGVLGWRLLRSMANVRSGSKQARSS